MTPHRRLRWSFAAAAAAASIALVGSPLHAAAKTSPGPALHARALGHVHAAAKATTTVPHGQAKGHVKALTLAPRTATLNANVVLGAIATSSAPQLATAFRTAPAHSGLSRPIAVAVHAGSAPPALGGLITLPQGPVAGRPPSTASSDTVDIWGVIAVAEGVAIAALLVAVWRRGRRSTAGSR